ncbi:MAG: serine hydrolase domain-containing protein [Methanomicrobiales archaeon]|nr:serine hydrolase domain-containing protein [Methanomicrobiales archaeon]
MEISRTQKIEHVFDRFRNSNPVHEGVLFVESTDGDFSYSRGCGGRDLDSPLLMASVTKLFTTACILALREQGRLSLDDTVANYFDPAVLRGLHVYRGQEYSFDLTVSDLLHQVSGLPDAYEEGDGSLKSRLVREDFSITFEELVAETKRRRPHFAPRTRRRAHYADINFDMLGEIVETVTALPLAEVFRQFVCEPLGLKSTYLPACENDSVPDICCNDTAIRRPKFVRSSRASGGCITTARDLMAFVKGFFGGRLFDGAVFDTLSASNRLQASRGPIHYGSGYMRIPLEGLATLFLGRGELIGHSGSTGSFAFYYPLKELFFVGDLNQMGNAALPVRLSLRLAMLARSW